MAAASRPWCARARLGDSNVVSQGTGGSLEGRREGGRPLFGCPGSRLTPNLFCAPQPGAGEQGLRVIAGATAREAAALGLSATPAFCVYDRHGPTFRVFISVRDRAAAAPDECWVTRCPLCGDQQSFVGQEHAVPVSCRCGASLQTSGPVWGGPLHDTAALSAMAAVASEWGWLTAGRTPTEAASKQRPLSELLQTLQAEARAASCPPFTWHTEEIARHGRLAATPPRAALINALRERGYPAAASHTGPTAFKSDASYDTLLATAAHCAAAVARDGRTCAHVGLM